MQERQHHHHRRRHAWLRWWWIGIGLVAVAALFLAGMAWRNLKITTTEMYAPVTTDATSQLKARLAKRQPISLLLLGTDTGALGRSDRGRTDTVMVMTINPQQQRSVLVSLPRDMAVRAANQPDGSVTKLNAAYPQGGIKNTMGTVTDYYQVPLNGYVLVNMGGLERAIDQVGGVKVTAPQTFTYGGHHFVKGQSQTMNGATALAFSRMRYEDPQGDYGRQARQRLVVLALLKKSAAYRTVLNRAFLHQVANETQTNLNLGEMRRLALNYRTATHHLQTTHAQGQGTMIEGQAMEQVSPAERQRVSNLLRKNLGLHPTTVTEERD